MRFVYALAAVVLGVLVALALGSSSPSSGAKPPCNPKHGCPTTTSTTTTTTTTTTTAPTDPQPVGGPGGAWRLTFRDEFSGTALDTSKWTPTWVGSSGPVNGLEDNCYSPSNDVVSGGNLAITLRQQSCVDKNGQTQPYTSGIVNTYDASVPNGFEQLYGYYEARMFVPDPATGKVNDWPAWWLANESNGTYPEIDIAEAGGGTMSYHIHMPAGAPGGEVAGSWTGWHTFAIDWQQGSVTWYYDGVQVARLTSPIPQTPLFLIINMGVSAPGQCCGGPIVAPNTILTDYVRVWQR